MKLNQVKVKWGSKSSKLKEAAKSSKVSQSEKIPIKQIKDTSIWHTRYWKVLVQESPNSSLRQQQWGNIEGVSNKITILWYMRKH